MIFLNKMSAAQYKLIWNVQQSKWAYIVHQTYFLSSPSKQSVSQAPQAQNTWCMRKLVYIEHCMRKSPIVKKNCVNNYLIWNKVFLPQMCHELVSCAYFTAILTSFCGVIWNRYSSFFHSFRRRSQNGVRMALKWAQETSSRHIWGRKTLFQMR